LQKGVFSQESFVDFKKIQRMCSEAAPSDAEDVFVQRFQKK